VMRPQPSARQLVDGHDVGLWQGDRKVALFKHEER
jgi:hypothetical protein